MTHSHISMSEVPENIWMSAHQNYCVKTSWRDRDPQKKAKRKQSMPPQTKKSLLPQKKWRPPNITPPNPDKYNDRAGMSKKSVMFFNIVSNWFEQYALTQVDLN